MPSICVKLKNYSKVNAFIYFFMYFSRFQFIFVYMHISFLNSYIYANYFPKTANYKASSCSWKLHARVRR